MYICPDNKFYYEYCQPNSTKNKTKNTINAKLGASSTDKLSPSVSTDHLPADHTY